MFFGFIMKVKENNNRTTAVIVFLCQASIRGIENMYN